MPAPFSLSVHGDDGISLSTSFQWVDGRFRHAIDLHCSGGTLIDSWTDEAISGNEDWPASPPIQQLSLESIHGAPTLLGVGQAGKSHWSISVETLKLDSIPALKFDLACRCREQPSWLGSTYQRSSSLANQVPRLRLIDDTRIDIAANATLIVNCQVDPSANAKYPRTFRWSYLVTLI